MHASFGQRKKKCFVMAFLIVLLVSVTITSLFVTLARANPYMFHEEVSPPSDVQPTVMLINSVVNRTIYASNEISIPLNVSIPKTEAIEEYHLSIGGIYYQIDRDKTYFPVYRWSGSGPTITDFSGDAIISELSEGFHNVTFMSSVDGGYADGLTSYWFGMHSYLTISFLVDTISPEISFLSTENMTYDVSDVPLNFSVNEEVIGMSYSLDGLDSVIIAGNTTLTDLSVGVHNVTIHAWDEAGNIGTSETLIFTIAEPEPEPFAVAPVAVASAASVAAVSVVLLVYFKKHKR